MEFNRMRRMASISSIRKKCFYWRHRLENNSEKMQKSKLAMGGIFCFHLFLPLMIMLVMFRQCPISVDKYRFAAMPLLLLSIEVFLVCTVLIFEILKDCFRVKTTFSSWNREVILSLLRNLLVSFMCSLSLIFWIASIKSTDDKIEDINLQLILSPLMVLAGLSILKQLFIRSKSQLVFTFVTILSLIQLFFILYGQSFAVWLLLTPSFLVLIILILNRSVSIYKALLRKQTDKFYLAMTALVGMVVLSLSIGIYCFHPAFNGILLRIVILSILCIVIGFIYKMGDFVYDLFLGHVETDYSHFLVPARVLREIPKRSFNDLLGHLSHPLLKK